MAAPQVTAAAALIMSHATQLTPTEVRQLLIDTAVSASALTGKCVSGGYLSISSAIASLYSTSRAAYSKGDVDGNGEVTLQDYMLIRYIVLGSYDATEEQLYAADVDGNGEVTLQDYILAQKHVLQTYYIAP